MKTAMKVVSVAVVLLNLSSASACTASDGSKIMEWMKACDSVVGSSQAKCDSKTCHTALHRLIEEETVACYVQLGLGPSSALSKYKPLDDFCHGEGPDPAAPAPAPTPAPTPSPTSAPNPGPAPIPSTTSPAPGPTTPSTTPPTPTATANSNGQATETSTEPTPTTVAPTDAKNTTADTTEEGSLPEEDAGSSAPSDNGASEKETVKIDPASTQAPGTTTPKSGTGSSIALLSSAVATLCAFTQIL